MYVIRNTKSRVWLMEYGPEHGNLQALWWTWTLEWSNATRYPTQEAAEDIITKFSLEGLGVAETTRLITKELL